MGDILVYPQHGDPYQINSAKGQLKYTIEWDERAPFL
jgi:hypothetical protein